MLLLIFTPPLHSLNGNKWHEYFRGCMLFLPPKWQCQSIEGKWLYVKNGSYAVTLWVPGVFTLSGARHDYGIQWQNATISFHHLLFASVSDAADGQRVYVRPLEVRSSVLNDGQRDTPLDALMKQERPAARQVIRLWHAGRHVSNIKHSHITSEAALSTCWHNNKAAAFQAVSVLWPLMCNKGSGNTHQDNHITPITFLRCE